MTKVEELRDREGTPVEDLRDSILGVCGGEHAENVAWLREHLVSLIAAAHAEGETRGEEKMARAAEMLWTVVANASRGDWDKQSIEWQEAAARWRDFYFSCLPVLAPPPKERKL